jgi:hypothetical protein
MRILQITGALLFCMIALADPLSADHDQGHQKSQDRLHRNRPKPKDVMAPPSGKPTTPPAIPRAVVTVPGPSSLALFAVGAALVGLTALRRH